MTLKGRRTHKLCWEGWTGARGGYLFWRLESQIPRWVNVKGWTSNGQRAQTGQSLPPSLEYMWHGSIAHEWNKHKQWKFCFPCRCLSIHAGIQWKAGLGVWSGGVCESRALTVLPSLTVGSGMQLFSMCLLTFANNVCPHSSVTPESFWRMEARVKCAVEMQKRFKNSVLCTLPALHQRGSLLVAVVLGHFRDHSWVDRTLQPTIYEAFPPSPYSVATGESGCRWCLAFAGLCESPPATDYWAASISSWTHLWWRNYYIGKNTVILDALTWSTNVYVLHDRKPWEVIWDRVFKYHAMVCYQVCCK